MSPSDKFSELLAMYLDEEPDAESLELLAEQLRTSKECRAEFRDAIRMHVLAREIAGEQAARSYTTEAIGEAGQDRSRVLRIRWVAAAAAVLLLGIAVLWFVQRGKDPKDGNNPLPPDPSVVDASWLESFPADSVGQRQMGTLRITPLESEGEAGGGPTELPWVTHSTDGNAAEVPGNAFFVDQFEFRFSIPESIPPDWEFTRAKVLSPSRAQLIYRRDNYELFVFLWPDSGTDRAPTQVDLGNEGRRVTVLRRSGLAIAFEGGQAEDQIWLKTAKQFLPTNNDGK